MKPNATDKRIIKAHSPRVIHYVDTVGNEAEQVSFETIVITDKTSRTWLRKHQNTFKGEKKLKAETAPEPFHGKPAQELWEFYLSEDV